MNPEELTAKELRMIQKWYMFFEGVVGYKTTDNDLWQKIRELADEMEDDTWKNS